VIRLADTKRRLAGLVAAFACLAIPLPSSAQALTGCIAGQRVIDTEGKIGTIVSTGNALCQVRYADGNTYGWIFWNLRAAPASAGATGGANSPGPTLRPLPPGHAAASGSVRAPTILRPSTTHTLVYRADSRGHFLITAEVNGTPIRLLVDTGASLVFLTQQDARAIGISQSELAFDRTVETGNGPAQAAPVLLREIRIAQLSLDNVRAAVIENLGQSVLGMSFLDRLKGFSMREGALTIDW
jgi:aspartyl protease family protein